MFEPESEDVLYFTPQSWKRAPMAQRALLVLEMIREVTVLQQLPSGLDSQGRV